MTKTLNSAEIEEVLQADPAWKLKLERTRHRKDHRLRPVTVYVPDLEDEAKNHALDRLLADIATRIGKLTDSN